MTLIGKSSAQVLIATAAISLALSAVSGHAMAPRGSAPEASENTVDVPEPQSNRTCQVTFNRMTMSACTIDVERVTGGRRERVYMGHSFSCGLLRQWLARPINDANQAFENFRRFGICPD